MAINGRVVITQGKPRRTARPQVVEFTDAALNRLKFLKSKAPIGEDAFKLGVSRRGCNGQSIILEFTNSANRDRLDEMVEVDGVKLVVDGKALLSVLGTKVDYEDSDAASQFVFYNPNAVATCGCGESFTLDANENLKE